MITYLFGIVFSLIVFVAIFVNLRAGRMKERYSTWWIVTGTAVVIVSVFPGTLEWLSAHLGVVVPLNLGIFAGGIVLLLMTLQYSVELSTSDEKQRRLAEEVALLSLRVRDLEARAEVPESADGSDNGDEGETNDVR